MKKRIFKFGAALTAALMMFSATASLAFAEGDVVDNDVDASVADTVEAPMPTPTVVPEDVEAPEEEVEAPEEDAEAPAPTEMPAEPTAAPAVVEEVVVPLDTETATEGDINLESVTADVDTGSVVNIGNIAATSDESYYNVNVPFTLTDGTSAPSQMSFFVYDITSITGEQNNTVGFTSTTTTPVGYINQYDGTVTGTYSFKLSKTDYNENSIIVVKIGGTGVSTPDAKSYTLGGASEYEYGDVNHDKDVNGRDAALIMRFYSADVSESDLDLSIADAYSDGTINPFDAGAVMQYRLGVVNELPIMPEN